MDVSKLFQVLVVAGAVQGLSGCETERSSGEQAGVDSGASEADSSANADAGVAMGEDAAMTPIDAGGEAVPCFCTIEPECPEDTAPAGFCCCWGGEPACPP